MAEADKGGPSVGAKAGEDVERARQRLEEEKRAAENLAHEARDAATGLGARARQAVERQGQAVRDEATSHLRNFAEAVRHAGDELADKEPGVVSDVVREAARGLEQFTESLEHKRPSDMFGAVRDFGRRHPGAFVAGTMVAGFAIARFATAATRSQGAGRTSYAGTEGGGYGGEARWAREEERTYPSRPASGAPGGYPGAGAGAGVSGTGVSGTGVGGAAGTGTSPASRPATPPSPTPTPGSASAGVAGTGAAHPSAPGAGGASYGSTGEGSGGPGFGPGRETGGSETKTGDKR